jgi:Ribbon-helix-helix protein, copG family.
MPLTKRVMVLFDPERYHRLKKEAKQRNSSVGALIREAVAKEVLEKGEVSRSTKLEAAKQLISMEEDVPDWKEIEKLITQGHLNE